jgi:hypothetical protein
MNTHQTQGPYFGTPLARRMDDQLYDIASTVWEPSLHSPTTWTAVIGASGLTCAYSNHPMAGRLADNVMRKDIRIPDVIESIDAAVVEMTPEIEAEQIRVQQAQVEANDRTITCGEEVSEKISLRLMLLGAKGNFEAMQAADFQSYWTHCRYEHNPEITL